MGTKDFQHDMLLPNSGIILGQIVDALRLRELTVSGEEVYKKFDNRFRTFCRFIAGERPSQDQLTNISQLVVEAMLGAYLDRGLLEKARECWLKNPLTSPIGDGLPEGLSGDLAAALKQMATSYDTIISTMHFPEGSILPEKTAAIAAIRLAIPRLSFWYAAVSIIEGKDIPDNEIPKWATKDGGREMFALWLAQGYPDKSRVNISREWDIHKSTIDRPLSYQNPTIPSDTILEDLSNKISARNNSSKESALLEMRRHYAAWGLAAEMAELVGWEEVGEIAKKLCVFANKVKRNFLREFPDKKHEEFLFGMLYPLLIIGDFYCPNDGNIKNLYENETDLEWREDLRAIIENRYDARTLDKFALTKMPYTDATEQQYLTLLKIIRGPLESLLALSWAARYDDWSDVMDIFNRSYADSKKDLIEWLKMKSEPYPEIIQKAKAVLKSPPHHIKTILLEMGRYHFTMGCIHFLHQEWNEALAFFEEAKKKKYLVSEAFDRAAYCAFILRDNKTGLDYAKTANAMGIGRTYRIMPRSKTFLWTPSMRELSEAIIPRP